MDTEEALRRRQTDQLAIKLAKAASGQRADVVIAACVKLITGSLEQCPQDVRAELAANFTQMMQFILSRLVPPQ